MRKSWNTLALIVIFGLAVQAIDALEAKALEQNKVKKEGDGSSFKTLKKYKSKASKALGFNKSNKLEANNSKSKDKPVKPHDFSTKKESKSPFKKLFSSKSKKEGKGSKIHSSKGKEENEKIIKPLDFSLEGEGDDDKAQTKKIGRNDIELDTEGFEARLKKRILSEEELKDTQDQDCHQAHSIMHKLERCEKSEHKGIDKKECDKLLADKIAPLKRASRFQDRCDQHKYRKIQLSLYF